MRMLNKQGQSTLQRDSAETPVRIGRSIQVLLVKLAIRRLLSANHSFNMGNCICCCLGNTEEQFPDEGSVEEGRNEGADVNSYYDLVVTWCCAMPKVKEESSDDQIVKVQSTEVNKDIVSIYTSTVIIIM